MTVEVWKGKRKEGVWTHNGEELLPNITLVHEMYETQKIVKYEVLKLIGKVPLKGENRTGLRQRCTYKSYREIMWARKEKTESWIFWTCMNWKVEISGITSLE